MSAFVPDGKIIKLLSNDGNVFEVPQSVLKFSGYVTSLESFADLKDGDEVPTVVEGPILAKVVEFLTHYNEEPMKEFEKVSEFFTLFFLSK
jgi:hypothetical protein